MQRTIIIFLLLFSFCVNAQNRVHIKILSIADSLPVKNYPFRLTKKTIVISDSTGMVNMSTNKKRIRIKNLWRPPNSFDTTVRVKEPGDTIIIYAIHGFDSSQAKFDIAHNIIQLFCGGGIIVLGPREGDSDFEKEYGVHYNLMDCVVADTHENLAAYNNLVAEYLDKKYGPAWRSKLRPDVHGITK